MREVVIVQAVRTPMGRRNGVLSGIHPNELGAKVLNEVVKRAGIESGMVEDVVFGCVDQVGEQGANVARNVLLTADFPYTVPATSVDRQCGSGQQAVHFAANLISSGVCDITIGGGVESMSRVPLGVNIMQGPGAPFTPALMEKYPLTPHGISAEEIAVKWGGRSGGQAVVGSDPVLMLTGPITATPKVLKHAGLEMKDIDLIEINEAFASVILAWKREVHPDMAGVNVNGGAIALGHPLGATGARLMTTMLHELERTGGRYGMQVMCCGGGLGPAAIMERLGLAGHSPLGRSGRRSARS